MPKTERLASGNYRIRFYYTDDTGKHSKSITAPTARECRQRYSEYVAMEKENGLPMTFERALYSYIETKSAVLSPSTLRAYRSIANRYYTELKPVRLDEITPAMIQRDVSENAKKVTPRAVKNIYGLMTAVLKMYYPRAICDVKLPQKEKREIQIPSQTQIEAILAQVSNDSVNIPIMLAALQGLRMSEILGLRWDCVDFDAKTITIKEARVLDENREYVSKTTKTVSGTRVLNMFSPVEEALKKAPRDGDYVVTLTGKTIYSRYMKAQKAVGCRFTFHALRHYACSVMLSLAVPNNYVANILGHSTTAMVEQVYGHVIKEKRDEFFDRINGFYTNKK